MAEQIEMPFDVWIQVSVYLMGEGVRIPPEEVAILGWRSGRAIVKYRETPVGVLNPAKIFWR